MKQKKQKDRIEAPVTNTSRSVHQLTLQKAKSGDRKVLPAYKATPDAVQIKPKKSYFLGNLFRRRKSFSRSKRFGLLHLNGYSLLTVYFIAIVTIGIIQSGMLQDIRLHQGSVHDAVARQLGFGLEKITISGMKQLRISEVLTAANITPKGSLPFLDANEARIRLERLPLIKTASLRKLYPDQVIITIEERIPHAIWQNEGELYIIARDGTVIDLMQDERFLNLPFVVGEYANTRTDEYLSLLESAGSLKDRIVAGTLVAGRRWTLKLDNGIDIRLPEINPQEAVRKLLSLDDERKILSKDILALDMRMPDRIIVRLSEEAAAERAEKNKNKVTKGRGVQT